MRIAHGRTWNLAINLTNKEMRNSHCRTWNMVRKMKNVENETHTVGPGTWQEN
jgi:hypothetical protein